MHYTKYLENYMPPYEINLENSGDKELYPKIFFKDYVERYVPYMIKKLREFGKNFEDCNVLDIGCGGGPLAAGFLLHRQAMEGGAGRYAGFDIRSDLVEWLSDAYASHPFIEFKKVPASADVDYLEALKSKQETTHTSDGAEAKLSVGDGVYDFQWTSSVFTHLTPESCVNMLQSIARASKKDAIHFNTWLIVDRESKYALKAGIADRNLPFDMGDFLTYLEKNPLVCTAYKEEQMFSYYEEAGLEIIAIEKGSWRGSIYQNDALHPQDIVISRVK